MRTFSLLKVSSTDKNCLVSLPPGKEGTQKVVVGDLEGVIQCFKVAKGKVQTVFKTMPSSDQPIACVRLGLVGGERTNKIFVASADGLVRGITKKGKEFFRLESSSLNSERVRCMDAAPPRLMLSGDYIFTEYSNNQESAFMLAPDRINYFFCADDASSIAACQDRFIRSIYGGAIRYEVRIEGGAPTSVMPLPQSGGAGGSGKQLIFGTDQGKLGHLAYDPSSDTFRRGWMIDSSDVRGSVACMNSGDMTGDGTEDLIVGRDDGGVEIYGFDVDADRPLLAFQTQLQESVTAVTTAVFNSRDNPRDLILSTFSGKIVDLARTGLKGWRVGAAVEGEGEGDKKRVGPTTNEQKHPDQSEIVSMRTEISKLRDEVHKMREKASHATVAASAAKTAESFKALLKVRVDHSFVLDVDTATHILSLECDMPVEMVVLRSDLEGVELLPLAFSRLNFVLAEGAASPSGISSETPSEQLSESADCAFLATYRVSEPSVHRLSVRLRLPEGAHGVVHVFVQPFAEPKTSVRIEVPVAVLPLHRRVSASELPKEFGFVSKELKGFPGDDTHGEERESTLHVSNWPSARITGDFSRAEAHGWLSSVFADLPPLWQDATQDSPDLYVFRNSFFLPPLHFVVRVAVRDKVCLLESNDICSLIACREFFLKSATSRKVSIASSGMERVSDASFDAYLTALLPVFADHVEWSSKREWSDALREVDAERLADPSLGEVLVVPEWSKALSLMSDKSFRMEDDLRRVERDRRYLESRFEKLLLSKSRWRGRMVSGVPDAKNVLDPKKFRADVLQMKLSNC